MRRRPHAGLVVATLLASASLSAQQTADQARLVFTVGVGQTASTAQLWQVPNQPLQVSGGTDTLDVSRAFRPTLNVVLSGTYFPGPHLGVNFEVQMLGLGTTSHCRVVAAGTDPTTTQLCADLEGRERTGSAVSTSVGGVYRPFSNQPIHPYLKLSTGITISQQDYVTTIGTLNRGTGNEVDLVLYQNRNSPGLQPYLGFGGGLVAVIGKGYQFHFELRDNWVRVVRITGPTGFQGLEPPMETTGLHVLSFHFGFDVVLERKRGRRY